MLIAQKIANLLNGVSQRPPEFRPSSQAELQENVMSHRVLGVRRRPPTSHVARLTATTSGYGSAFIHEVRQSSTDKYYVVAVGGDLKVFDATTGTEQTVVFAKGKSYLTSTKGFKAFTVGDTTYLLNMDTVVGMAALKAPIQAYEALAFVRQADYSTRYSVTLNGVSCVVDTPDASSPQARLEIATDTLASEIAFAISASSIGAEFDVEPLGSTIYLKRHDSKDFTITAADGLADKGLKIVKGSVQTFADLPARAVNGMIVEVAGDPESTADNYWVRYTDQAQPGDMGVWVECAAPGTPIALDSTTMPWTLVRKGTVLADIQSDDAPSSPIVVPQTGSAFSGGFTSDPDTGDSFTGDQDIVLTNDDQRVDASLTGLTGVQQTVNIFYDVDTTLLDYGQNVAVDLMLDTGAGFTVVASQVYNAGLKLSTERLYYTTVIPGGSSVRVQIHYGGDSTPDSKSRLALVTIHRGSSTEGSGISSVITTAILVGFNPAAIYPVGTAITIHVSGSSWTHTVSGSDETGSTVATALIALISGYTVTATAAGVFTVANFSGTSITWALSVVITQPALTFYDSAITMTPAEHVGRIIVNTTDGSQGVVTANSIHSITVSALSGGISNTFHPGDICNVNGSATDFVFSTASWAQREAGDIKICPMPSFVGSALNEIFFYQNRLGFTAGPYIVLSASGDLTNFMRQTATQLLSSDVIDVRSAYPNASTFENAKEWNDELYLFSASGEQFALSGEPVLSPQTVSITHKSSFPMTGGVRPVTMGKYLYFGRSKSTFTQIMQYFLTINGRADAVDLTEDVPQYLSGSPMRIVGDAALEIIVSLTSGAPDTLWVYTYHYEGDQTSPYASPQKTMGSWSKWTFSGAQIIAINMLDGVLSMIVIRSDGVYLEHMDLGVLSAGNAVYQDRQGSGSPVGYTSRYRFSTVFLRDKNDAPETRGRLQLRYGTLNYHDSTAFSITVTPVGRSPMTYTFNAVSPAAGDFQFPIQTRNTLATVELSTAGSGGFAFSGFDWEGDYSTRDKRA